MRHLHIPIFIFLVAVFSCDFAQAQRAVHRGAFSATINADKKYPYYSALDITDAINQNKPDRVIEILYDYSGSESYLEPRELRELYRENKFIQETFFIPDSINRPALYQKKIKSDSLDVQPAPPPILMGRSIDNDGSGDNKSSMLKSIGSLDATIVADAFAKIVVKRFKQDVNEIFFEQMKTAMDSTVELTVLLPHTHQLLQLVDKDIYNFQTYIDGLRQKLEEDFSNIFAGTNALLETPKYKNRFTKDVVSQSIISTMLQVSDGLVNKRQPGIIIEQLNLNGNYDQNEEGRNIKQGLQMLQIFSSGLQSKYPDHYWVSGLDSLNMLFKGDTNVGKVWLGLLCQSVKPDTLNKGKLNKTLMFTNKMTMHDAIHKMYYEPAYYTQSQNFFGSLINQVNQIELTVSDIKESGKKGAPINWTQAVSVYENAVSLIKLAPEIKTIFNKNYVLPQHWTRGLFIAETMPRVYAEMKGKQYHAAVQHIAGLIKAFDFSELYTKGTIKIIKIDTIRNGIAAPKLLSHTVDVEKVFRIDTMRSFFYVNDAGEKQPRHEYCDPVGNFIKCDSVLFR